MVKRGLLKFKGDALILLLAVGISLFGVVAVYSASNYSALKDYDDALFYVKKQLVGVILGVIAMLFTVNFSYLKYRRLGIPSVIVSVLLLSLVFIPGVGVESYGAKRWIGLGGITLQPSEIAKFSLVLFTACYFSKKSERVNCFKGIIPVILVGVTFCCLIIAEPNMSITMCVGLLMVGLLFASGARWRYIALIIIPIIAIAPILVIIEPYRLSRLTAFLNPWASPKGEGYQLLQSLYALGSGGWFGVGLFNSRQKFEFLPFSESDFILSVIGEEIGFVGIVLTFGCMFLLIYRGIKTAFEAKDLFGSILASGITLVYAIQVSLNALVVSGSIPPTGLPLPLISSGNTSVIVFLTAFGVLYNISASSKDVNYLLE